MSKPKYLIRQQSWIGEEKATNEGEWPFQFGDWKMTFYPYLHNDRDEIIWLEPEVQHFHAFTTQSIKMLNKLPEWNSLKGGYDETVELPYCLHCGIFMEEEHYESFMRSKEMVTLAVKRGGPGV